MANDRRPTYTPKEVLEILQEAQRYNVDWIKLEGFEAKFLVQDAPGAQRERKAGPQPQAPNAKPDGFCVSCGIEVEEDWMKYCRDCYRPPQNGRYGRRSRR